MKKTIIFFTMLLILSSFTYAIVNDAIIYYSFDNSTVSGTTVTDLAGNYDGTKAGTTDPAQIGNGKLVDAIYLDGANDYVNTNATVTENLYAISFWIKPNQAEVIDCTHYQPVLGQPSDSYPFLMLCPKGWDGSASGSIMLIDNNVEGNGLNHALTGGWEYIVFNWNSSSSTYDIYLNGVRETITTYSGGITALITDDMVLSFGQRNGGYGSTFIDEFAYYDHILTQDDIDSLYNSNLSYNPYFILPIVINNSLSITLLNPSNDEIINNNYINFSYIPNASNETISNCSLYINSNLNQTDNSIENGTLNYFNNTEVGEGIYNWSVSCIGGPSNYFIYNSSVWNLTVDLTSPNINADKIKLNKTIVYNLLEGNINITDGNLFSLLFTINGTTITNISDLNNSFYQYNYSVNLTSYSSGEYEGTIRTCDGHTNNKLTENYIINNKLSGLEFKTDNDYVKINPENLDFFDSFETIKSIDRYSFKYKQSAMGNLYNTNKLTFLVESNKKIYYREDNEYNAWFIIPEVGEKGRWIDFNIKGDKPNYEVEKINDFKYKVTIKNLKKTDDVIFESIGELNCNEESYLFYHYNYTTSYTSPVLETTTQTYIFNITKDSSYISDIDATLIYNGTNYTFTKTAEADYIYFETDFNIGAVETSTTKYFNISYSIIGSENSTTLTSTYGQSIAKILIDNCSTYTTKALNISTYAENGTLTNSEVDGYFEVWTETARSNFNLSWKGSNQYYVCINPPYAQYSVYAQLEYIGDGYIKKTHYLYNTTLSNQSQKVDLYLTQNTTTSLVTFTVSDQDDNDVEEVYINVLKYDFATNSHTTHEILKTDEDGEAIGNIVLDTQWYKFILYYQGNIVFESEPVKITGTSRNFRINTLSDYFDFYNIKDGITTDLSFTNATGNFAYTFLNPSGTSVTSCLRVIERNIVQETLVNETCISSSSGTILINIGTNVSDKTYIATGTIQINPTFLTDITSVSFESGYQRFGKDGIFMVFMVRLTMALTGIWNPVIAIFLLLITDIGLIVAGLYSMSWEALVIYLILGGITMWRVNRK